MSDTTLHRDHLYGVVSPSHLLYTFEIQFFGKLKGFNVGEQDILWLDATLGDHLILVCTVR